MSDDPRFVQKGFGLKSKVAEELAVDYRSALLDGLRALGSSVSVGRMTLHLAEEFGFCYGVDRAIDYPYETRSHFPDRTVYVTNEIIHNPFVNERLRSLGFRFFGEGWSLEDVAHEDVVLLPAFGATVELVDQLRARGCVIVDTTCGSVMNVWKRVRRYTRDGFTSIIHGKHQHEETVATASHATSGGGAVLVVRDEQEASLVCRVIRGELSAESVLERLGQACSPGFDPARDLRRIGVANQTTMLASESLHISALLEGAVRARDGAEGVLANFRRFDTICSATQDRQDAILKLGEREPLDVILVIGGFNSSNTTHLCGIAGRFAPSYHISGTEDLVSAGEIRHQGHGEQSLTVARDWLPTGRLRVGVTSGASTPNSIVAGVIERLGELIGVDVGAHIAELRPAEVALATGAPAADRRDGPQPLPLHDPEALL